MPEPDRSNDIYGDEFGPLKQNLGKPITDALARLPASLNAALEAHEGPIQIPADQWSEAQRNILLAVVGIMEDVTGALDGARARITKLEKRLAELESRD